MRVALPGRGFSLFVLLGACESVPYRVLDRGETTGAGSNVDCTEACCTPWMEVARTPEDAALLLERRLARPGDLVAELRDGEQLLFSGASACPVLNVRYRITSVTLTDDALLVDHRIHVPIGGITLATISTPYEVIALPLQAENVTYESTFESNYPPPGFGE